MILHFNYGIVQILGYLGYGNISYIYAISPIHTQLEIVYRLLKMCGTIISSFEWLDTKDWDLVYRQTTILPIF